MVDINGVRINPLRVVVFEVTVTPDGAVRYRDGSSLDGVYWLAFELDTSWETSVSPGHGVLEELYEAISQ